MKINLYKIDSKSVEELSKRLKKSGYKLASKVETSSGIVYLYINKKNRQQKEWLDRLIKIFDLKEVNFNFGEIYNAILIVSVNEDFFGIPFGYAFHILREICEPEFAMKFAEVQIEPSSVDLKSSFFIQSTKIKELISYRHGSNLRYEPGESFYLVSGKPKDMYFGKRIKCGLSVEFSKPLVLEDRNSLVNITEFVAKVRTILSTTTTLNFPRIFRYKKSDSITEKLDNILLERLKNNDFKKAEIIIDSLPNFLQYGTLPTNEMCIIKYKKHSKKYEGLTLKNICEFLSEFDVEELKNVEVVVEGQESEEKVLKLKDLLLVHLENDKKRYILNESFWGEYNNSFIELVEKKLNEITREKVFLNKFGIKDFKDENEYIKKINDKFPDAIKLHKVFINFSFNETKVKNIELADLYKNRELITIKLGDDNSAFCYAFDQAYQGVYCLNEDSKAVLSEKLKGKLDNIGMEKIKEILNAKTYALLLGFKQKTYSDKIKNNEFNLNDLGSFILKLKILWWDNFIKDKEINYKIYVEGIAN
ncbi:MULTISPECIES: TIGR04141 family sporadically distributed protein [unclassified Thermosipho (in: thermotogales)]|uniref:TIGR04141 family sporadically distributed protein n=1 Tax=unclassified Thermosipho (in: thermotogales) TaxID=2676525 RepID=UPI0009866A8A|nr:MULTISPECIES: TIGR04141 family sporadically distributed protein [unclassified Thermosipho (in: thermotogales)]MBT1247359.1 hypothetical protein [Thermosipho sp. 1244]OOC46957.1 hypothetical protein XO09_04160 [Thermosipho sp. 1223]